MNGRSKHQAAATRLLEVNSDLLADDLEASELEEFIEHLTDALAAAEVEGRKPPTQSSLTFHDMEQRVIAAGYRISTREEFISSRELPPGLIGRAILLGVTHLAHVVWDPNSDEDGWMIWGDDREALIRETFQMRLVND